MPTVFRRAVRRAYALTFVACFTAVALIAGLLSSAVNAHAVDPQVPPVAIVARASDKAGVIRLWQTAGETTRTAAEAALLGGRSP